jgi:hypothetical protein
VNLGNTRWTGSGLVFEGVVWQRERVWMGVLEGAMEGEDLGAGDGYKASDEHGKEL